MDQAIRNEILLIVFLALAIILFLCNFGIVGEVGNAVSNFLFGIFGLPAYIAPVIFFFAVAFGMSNAGNFIATRKLIAGGVLFLIVSVVLHILIPSQIRTLETSAVTAATVPTLLIRGMIICSVILLVQGILSKEKTEYTISGAIFTRENLLRLKPVIYIAMLIAYALLLPHIGFIISSLLLANGILLYFGTRKWWFYAIASANVIVAYFAFQAMSVTLP